MDYANNGAATETSHSLKNQENDKNTVSSGKRPYKTANFSDFKKRAGGFRAKVKEALAEKAAAEDKHALDAVREEILICVEAGLSQTMIAQMLAETLNTRITSKHLGDYLKEHLRLKIVNARYPKVLKLDEDGNEIGSLEFDSETTKKCLSKLDAICKK